MKIYALLTIPFPIWCVETRPTISRLQAMLVSVMENCIPSCFQGNKKLLDSLYSFLYVIYTGITKINDALDKPINYLYNVTGYIHFFKQI